MPCVHCGAAIKLRSFWLAPSNCPQCGKMTPDGMGCLFFTFAIAGAFGLVGAGIGWVVARLVNSPYFVPAFTFLAAIDGCGFAYIWYWRSTDRARELGPKAMFCLFALLGVKFGAIGSAVTVLMICVANGLFGYGIARLLVRQPPPVESDDDPG